LQRFRESICVAHTDMKNNLVDFGCIGLTSVRKKDITALFVVKVGI
jgi:hypothetical protein